MELSIISQLKLCASRSVILFIHYVLVQLLNSRINIKTGTMNQMHGASMHHASLQQVYESVLVPALLILVATLIDLQV